MSNLLECRCGYIFESGEAGLRHRAELIRGQSRRAFVSAIADDIAELLEFDKSGRRREWVLTRMGADYPDDATIKEVVEDLFEQQRVRHGLHALQCPGCGTLYVERGALTWKYWSFAPADAPNDVFAVKE